MDNISIITYFKLRGVLSSPFQNALCLVKHTFYACYPASYAYCSTHTLVVVLNMPEHSSFQDVLFPMLFISKYAKSYASIMDTEYKPNTHICHAFDRSTLGVCSNIFYSVVQ